MYSEKISYKKAWEQIAQMMNSKGYTMTGRQYITRVNTIQGKEHTKL